MNEEAMKYFKSLSTIERRAICQKAQISYKWLSNMVYENRYCSPLTAVRLENATKGRVSRWWLRPDIDWSLVKTDEF